MQEIHYTRKYCTGTKNKEFTESLDAFQIKGLEIQIPDNNNALHSGLQLCILVYGMVRHVTTVKSEKISYHHKDAFFMADSLFFLKLDELNSNLIEKPVEFTILGIFWKSEKLMPLSGKFDDN